MQRNNIKLPRIFKAVEENDTVTIISLIDQANSLLTRQFDGDSLHTPYDFQSTAPGTPEWEREQEFKRFPWYEKTVLTFASNIGRWECVQAILDAFTITNFKTLNELLWDAARGNQIELVRTLLQKRANPGYLFLYNNINRNCVYWATAYNNVDMLKLFLPYTQIFVKKDDFDSPCRKIIRDAFKAKSWDCINLLMSKSLCLKSIGYYAIKNKNEALVLEVLKAGVFKNVKYHTTDYALCQRWIELCAQHNLPTALSLLLKKGEASRDTLIKAQKNAKKSEAYDCIIKCHEYSAFNYLDYYDDRVIINTFPLEALANFIQSFSRWISEGKFKTTEIIIKSNTLKTLNDLLINKIIENLKSDHSAETSTTDSAEKNYVSLEHLVNPYNNTSKSWETLQNIMREYHIPTREAKWIITALTIKSQHDTYMQSIKAHLLSLKKQCETFQGKISIGRYWWWVDGTPKGVTTMKEILKQLNVDSSDETVIQCYSSIHQFLSRANNRFNPENTAAEHQHETTTALYKNSFEQLEDLFKKPQQPPLLSLPRAGQTYTRLFTNTNLFPIPPEPSAPLMTNPDSATIPASDSTPLAEDSTFEEVQNVIVTTTQAPTIPPDAQLTNNEDNFQKQFPSVPTHAEIKQPRIASPAT